MSQVERGVHRVERLSVLQALADALRVSINDLRPDAEPIEPAAQEAPVVNDLDTVRLTLTGHPALDSLFDNESVPIQVDVKRLREHVQKAWMFAHGSRYAELSRELSDLLPRLENAVRHTNKKQSAEVHDLRASAYQAAAAAFARQDEPDAAWVAADRAIAAAEASGDPLQVIAGLFRMAHAFMRLARFDQAERTVGSAIETLQRRVEQSDYRQEELSLFGAMHLVLALISAREGRRSDARKRIQQAREIAQRLGEDRNDFETEFGPTNVELHAVSVATDLGDAGEALDTAREINASQLSPERQARFLLDVARAHAQRRQVGEATAALLEGEQLAPELVHSHHHARETIQVLLQLTGRRPPKELQDIAHRSGAIP